MRRRLVEVQRHVYPGHFGQPGYDVRTYGRQPSRGALFGWFTLAYLLVCFVSAVVGFLLVWFLIYIALIGWLPFATSGLVMLLASRHMPALRWAALGGLAATAALYIPLAMWLLKPDTSTAEFLLWIAIGTGVALTAAGLIAALHRPGARRA